METILLVNKKEFKKDNKIYYIFECYNSLGFLFKSFVDKDSFDVYDIGTELSDYTYRRYNTTKNLVEYYIKF